MTVVYWITGLLNHTQCILGLRAESRRLQLTGLEPVVLFSQRPQISNNFHFFVISPQFPWLRLTNQCLNIITNECVLEKQKRTCVRRTAGWCTCEHQSQGGFPDQLRHVCLTAELVRHLLIIWYHQTQWVPNFHLTHCKQTGTWGALPAHRLSNVKTLLSVNCSGSRTAYKGF